MSKVRSKKTNRRTNDAIERASRNGERVIVRRRNRPVAAVVPISELRFLEDIENHLDLEDARAALRESEKDKSRVSWEQLKAELGL